MAGSQTPAALSQLRVAQSHADQLSALRTLKNEVVGHHLKKEQCITAGVLDQLVEILSRSQSEPRSYEKDVKSRPLATSAALPKLTDEEAVRIQSLQLLSSFANAGPSFLPPIHSSGAIDQIITNIYPPTNPPQIVLAALRTLIGLSTASSLSSTGAEFDAILANSLFARPQAECWRYILSQSESDITTQTQINLAATLISRLCGEEAHQLALANCGVLDALATRLASFAVADGLVIPGAAATAGGDGLPEHIPGPAPRGAKLSVILEAIGSIMGDSRPRAKMLLFSNSIVSVFPTIHFTPSKPIRAAWHALDHSGTSHFSTLNAMDYMLPALPMTRSTKRPGGGGEVLGPDSAGSNLDRAATATAFSPELSEAESPLIPWLIYVTRSGDPTERLNAAAVLISLLRAGLGSKPIRECSLGLLVVPVLLTILKEQLSSPCPDTSMDIDASTAASWAVLERAPAVLSRLVSDHEALQKAAFECKAVRILSRLLKESYTPAVSTCSSMWSPWKDQDVDSETLPRSCVLGAPGQLPLLAHRLRVRENALKAIAAVGFRSDDYRKAFVDQDVVPYIVESLSPFPGKPLGSKERLKSERPLDEPLSSEAARAKEGYGRNPTSVIVAACHAVRMLSRSVAILRTSLVDHGVHRPLLRFLRHPDVEVQIAAAAVISNLVLDVSPMKEPLIEDGVMKILCEHAKSHNPALRLNALWGLKHLVCGESPSLKKDCLEHLGAGWLVQLICDDTEDEAVFLARTTAEQASSSTTVSDDMDEDTEMPQAEDGRGSGLDANGRRMTRLRQAEARSAALQESELAPVRRARNDDLAIQEQGLGFIQNLLSFSAPTSSDLSQMGEAADMIDFLFNELGQDRLFEILASKLKVKVLRPFSRRSATGSGSRVLYPQPKIIAAVTNILVHIAASVPRHRQLVIAQTELLKLLANHFKSNDVEVRLALCHLVTNLTWRDDDHDIEGCQQRALELKKLGYMTKLEDLEVKDVELNVKERAKNALWQLKQAYN